MPQASEPFSSAIRPDDPSPRGSQPPELPLLPKMRRFLPTPKQVARPVPKQKHGGPLLPPGFEQYHLSKRGRTEMPNSGNVERFGNILSKYAFGTPLRAQPRALMQALSRSEDGVACFPGQGSTDQSHPSVLELQGLRVAASFTETKTSFMGMWIRLEETLQNHESVLVKTKEDLAKSSADLKRAKERALKEREGLKAEIPGATKALETVSEQARKAKRVREGFEHFSTDLSVQLAELNRIQQQVQEQQTNLEALVKSKTHPEAQEKSKNVIFDTGSMKNDLQKFEARLAALEAELTANKLASEQLEQAVLKGMAGLNQFDEVSNSQQRCIP